MTLPEPSAPERLSAFASMLLIFGPDGIGPVNERDPRVRAELREVWGKHGENVARTWLANEGWLRAMAATHGWLPRFNGRFFGECKAADARGTR